MDENILKRILPHSLEAEQSVIGSMLMDKDAVATAVEIISKDDFYSTQYATMFECMAELFNEGKDIDLITVQNRLKEKGAPPEVSSLDFVKDIMNTVPTSANIKSYANIVHEKAVLRRLIHVNEDIANICYAGKEPVEDIVQKTEKDIFNVLQERQARDIVPINTVAEDVLKRIEKASKEKELVTGVPSGFVDLDKKTTGFQPSDFIVLAARPSMGKTAFSLNIVRNVAIKKKRPTLFFSLEMSKEQLVNRLLAMESGIDAMKLRTGDLNDSDWDQLVRAVVNVSSANMAIDDTPGITLTEIRSKCRKMKLEKGLDLIVIDYLQLMGGGSNRYSDNRQQEISEISRGLKALAREMNAPVIALSQLSRAPETRTDHRPMLSDLRESGSIEQDADLVMFLYRDDYYKPDSEHAGEVEVILAKQRNGPLATIILLWQAATTKFVNIAKS